MKKSADVIFKKIKLCEDSKNPISRNLYEKFSNFMIKLENAQESL